AAAPSAAARNTAEEPYPRSAQAVPRTATPAIVPATRRARGSGHGQGPATRPVPAPTSRAMMAVEAPAGVTEYSRDATATSAAPTHPLRPVAAHPTNTAANAAAATTATTTVTTSRVEDPAGSAAIGRATVASPYPVASAV